MADRPDDNAPVVMRHRGILGGRPTFRGTRVQAETLFDDLAAGIGLDEILENFPTLDRRDLETALGQACEALNKSAPEVTPEREADLSYAPIS